MKDQPNYSTVNGDPDATVTKITQNDIGAYDMLSDKSGRSQDNNGPLGLVTCIGQDKSACVYGNDLRVKNPCKMGGLFTLLFYRDQPLICIGPQCKLMFSFVYLFFN